MSASIDPAAIAHLEARIATELDVGNVLAAQFAIGFGGEIVASGSFGEALDDTRFCIFSATKALVSSTLIPFIASGALDPAATDRVVYRRTQAPGAISRMRTKADGP